MKKILLMMPSYYALDEVIIDGLTAYSEYEIHSIDTSFKFAYKNNFQRILNFFSKIFLHKNLKPKMRRKLILGLIDKFSEYEYLIVNRADIIDEDILEVATKKAKKSILILWDNQERYPTPKKMLNMFDDIYSFDKRDCENYGFKKIENFHFFERLPEQYIKYDAIFFGSLDNRIEDLTKLLNYLNQDGKNAHAYLNVPKGKEPILHPNIEWIDKIVPYKDSYKFALTGKTIIDLGHPNQNGLSFRFFEAMVFRKKIITTNLSAANYDFYNKNNIQIIKNINNIAIPNSFWETPYEELPADIFDKYHIKNWIKRILDKE